MKRRRFAMDLVDLEVMLTVALSAGRPSARDLRDALVDYFVVVARPFVQRGLVHTQPDADENELRRLMRVRLATLWRGLPSRWEDPSISDLLKFRQRIVQYACVSDVRLVRVHRQLDELTIAAVISERMKHTNRKLARRLRLIEGGGEVSAPRGRLRLVRETTAQDSSSLPVVPASS